MILYFPERANGLRYLRWGGGRRSRPARKMIRRRKLPEICAESPASGARFVSLLLIWKETLGEQIQFALLLPHQSQIQNELFLRHSQKQSCHFALKYS